MEQDKEKEAYYFSHDSNARSDIKVVALLQKHKWEGYGLYWAIIEMLRESTEYKLPTDFNLLAYELRSSNEIVCSIVTGFGLFTIDKENKKFWSNRLLRSMQKKNEKSQRAKEIAEKRWEKLEQQKQADGKSEIRMEEPQCYILLMYNDNEQFVKIGITDTYIARRYSGKLPYNYMVLRQVFSKNHLNIETALSDKFNRHRYTPDISFYGKYECFTTDILDDLLNTNLDKYEVIKDVKHFVDTSQILRNAIKVKESKEKKRNSIDSDGKKLPSTPKISIEVRQKEFYQQLVPFVETYGKDMIRKFYDYWREPNKSGTQMRYEQQKTWDISLRLNRWSKNQFDSGNGNTGGKKEMVI